MEDLDSIAADIRVMYDEVDAYYLYKPLLYIAFTDIDFDGIPEFFYGYQTITGSHNKIWYRAYSLKDRAMIGSEHTSIPSVHSPGWNMYIQGDTDCAFFTGPESFIEGYYLNDNEEPCFVTKSVAGAVTQIRIDYVFMEYTNSTLSVSAGFECDQELQAVKQVWSQVTLDSIKGDIHELLNEYLA